VRDRECHSFESSICRNRDSQSVFPCLTKPCSLPQASKCLALSAFIYQLSRSVVQRHSKIRINTSHAVLHENHPRKAHRYYHRCGRTKRKECNNGRRRTYHHFRLAFNRHECPPWVNLLASPTDAVLKSPNDLVLHRLATPHHHTKAYRSKGRTANPTGKPDSHANHAAHLQLQTSTSKPTLQLERQLDAAIEAKCRQE
jgi:hypothetical protein